MNPTDPTSPTPESNPPAPKSVVPKPVVPKPSVPELPVASKPNDPSPLAEVRVEKANPETKPEVFSPIILPTARPVKGTKQAIHFHREPEDDYDTVAEEEYLARKRKSRRTWIIILLVFLSLVILVPVAFVVFLFVICSGMSNNGRF